ncbi:MAG: carbon monoxide dehydrogenase subunit G [Saprospiraceae bacterium]|nr:carbon monoxide dehydrogenase subunit G [Saprospiraceae bacterium]
MTLDGNYTVNAPRETVWDLLMDPEVLARITPGITSLEKIDEDNYKAVAQLKIGPVGGAFSGNLSLADRKKPESFSLSIQQNSKIGNANAVVHMNLSTTETGQTAVQYTADVKLSGMLSTMGGRVITPVTKMLSEQFFEALEKEAAV